MITREQAEALPYGGTLHHKTRTQGRGEALRVRKSGAVRKWADGTWVMPVKWGLYESAYIGTHALTNKSVHDPEDWELPG